MAKLFALSRASTLNAIVELEPEGGSSAEHVLPFSLAQLPLKLKLLLPALAAKSV